MNERQNSGIARPLDRDISAHFSIWDFYWKNMKGRSGI
jgi:hypothetical protein